MKAEIKQMIVESRTTNVLIVALLFLLVVIFVFETMDFVKTDISPFLLDITLAVILFIVANQQKHILKKLVEVAQKIDDRQDGRASGG